MNIIRRNEEGKNYRESKRAAMGDTAYKVEEAFKRKQRRLRAAGVPVITPAVAVEIEEPEPEPEVPVVALDVLESNTDTLDDIYEAKLVLAKSKGHTIKRSSVETSYNRLKRIHKMMFNEPMTKFDWTKDTTKVSKFIDTYNIFQLPYRVTVNKCSYVSIGSIRYKEYINIQLPHRLSQ